MAMTLADKWKWWSLYHIHRIEPISMEPWPESGPAPQMREAAVELARWLAAVTGANQVGVYKWFALSIGLAAAWTAVFAVNGGGNSLVMALLMGSQVALLPSLRYRFTWVIILAPFLAKAANFATTGRFEFPFAVPAFLAELARSMGL